MVSVFLAMLLGLWASPTIPGVQLSHRVHVVNSQVYPYTQWGKYAMAQAEQRYPNFVITDYLHVGRTTYTSTYVRETFKFWLVNGNREMGVFVHVYFDPHTDKVSQVLFCETDH